MDIKIDIDVSLSFDRSKMRGRVAGGVGGISRPGGQTSRWGCFLPKLPLRTTHHTDILLLGAGLTGLTAAYYLRDSGLSVTLVEARDRIGGRIHTLYVERGAGLEMGATWLGRKHTALVELLEELNIEFYPQATDGRAIYEAEPGQPAQLVTLPPNPAPSHRIRGGSTALVRALAAQLPEDKLYLNQAVTRIEQSEDGLLARTADRVFRAQTIVSTLPPYLLTRSIALPDLPTELLAAARQTHTWMADSIKVGLVYEEPFWDQESSSGTLYSNLGPITELYDHSDAARGCYALKGFIDGRLHALPKAERRRLVLQHLVRCHGPIALNCLHYAEAVWRHAAGSFTPYTMPLRPHQNNGHPIFRQPFLDGRLLIAGSETADGFPGYMDGAVRSARWVAEQLK